MKEEKKTPSDLHDKAVPPMTPDEVFRLADVIKNGKPPDELKLLRSTNSFTVLDPPADLSLRSLAHEVLRNERMRAWHIDATNLVLPGLPVQEFIRQLPPTTGVESPTLPLPPPQQAFCPDWTDRIYRPRTVPRIMRPSIRRKNGGRVYPHGYIFNNDDRQAFQPTGYPWQCIGRLDVYTDPSSFLPSGWGTGALVGPNTVLTASHVVPWDANPAMIRFTPGYFNGVSTAGPAVYAYVNGASAYDTGRPPAAAFDFAVLRLEDRLGDSLGWLGTRTYSDSWNDENFWTLVGYPLLVAVGEQPSFQMGINFHDDDEDSSDFGTSMELETNNGDSSGGDSGGPYFAFWDNLPYVVGVDVGGESEFTFNPFARWPFEDENNVAAAGPAMVQIVQWARSNWG